jgi:predicted tellurium resistance membrane protein TerC
MNTGLVHSPSYRPFYFALAAGVLVSIVLFAILFTFANKKKRILWFAAASIMYAVFASLALATKHLYWWIPSYIFGFTAGIIVLVTLFQAGHESRVQARLAQQSAKKEEAET